MKLQTDALSIGVVTGIIAMIFNQALTAWFPRVSVLGIKPSMYIGLLAFVLLIAGRTARLKMTCSNTEWIRLAIIARWTLLVYWGIMLAGTIAGRFAMQRMVGILERI